MLLDLAVGGKARVTGSSLLSGVPEDSLTQEEVLALVEVSMSQGLEVTEKGIESKTLTDESFTVQLTTRCPMGGTVAVNGRSEFMGDPDSEDVAVSLSMTLVHA